MKRKQQVQGLASAGHLTSLDRIDDAIVVGSDGSIRINTAKLPAPQNVYDADYAWVVRRLGTVSLYFAKLDANDDQKLRTRLELRYPPEAFVFHLWKNSRDFHERLKQFVSKRPLDPSRQAVDPAKMRADKDHSDWANVDYLGHSGTHACLDFFNMSPVGVARFARDKTSASLALTPVVRVQMTAEELCRLLNACEPIALELGLEFPAKEYENE